MTFVGGGSDFPVFFPPLRLPSGVAKRVVFQKGGFGGCSPGNGNQNKGTFACSPERKPPF